MILLYKALVDYPVIALHNRYLGLNTRARAHSQGTWIGVNKAGLLLAITNQETETIDNPGRSRGKLALDVLRECSTSEAAKNYLFDESIRPNYRPGNFLIADRNNAWHVLCDNITTAWKIEPGPYEVGVITRHPDIKINRKSEKIAVDSEKRRKRGLQLLNEYQPRDIENAIEKMMDISGDHMYGKSTASICWHSEQYRLPSSTIIAVGENPEKTKAYYCEGNACLNQFQEYKVSFNKVL